MRGWGSYGVQETKLLVLRALQAAEFRIVQRVPATKEYRAMFVSAQDVLLDLVQLNRNTKSFLDEFFVEE